MLIHRPQKLKFFLQKSRETDVDVNERVRYGSHVGYTPLHVATMEGDERLIRCEAHAEMIRSWQMDTRPLKRARSCEGGQ